MDNLYRVYFVYTDYNPDEEPEMDYYEVGAKNIDEAMARTYEKFTPIEVFDVELIMGGE